MKNKIAEQNQQINIVIQRTQKRYVRWSKFKDLNYYVFSVMYMLSCNKITKQKDICDCCSMPKQTVNSVISELSRNGYVTLETDENDRRSKLISLTESGQKYADSIVGEIIEMEYNVIERMGEQHVNMLIELLDEFDVCLKDEINKHEGVEK